MLDLHKLSIRELRELISEINDLLPRAQESQWTIEVKRLEAEALEVVDELRKKTGRDYKLTLHGYPLRAR